MEIAPSQGMVGMSLVLLFAWVLASQLTAFLRAWREICEENKNFQLSNLTALLLRPTVLTVSEFKLLAARRINQAATKTA